MNLTEHELEHLEKIKRYQRNLFKMRYYFLSIGIILIGLALVPLFYCWSQGNMALVSKLTSHPSFYISPILGGVALGYSIQGWKGNSVYILLIKIVENLRGN